MRDSIHVHESNEALGKVGACGKIIWDGGVTGSGGGKQRGGSVLGCG